MFKISKQSKIHVYQAPVNMGKSFKGLGLLIEKSRRKTGPNDLFVFFSRKMDYIKVLYYEKFSACIWAKRLTPGFQFEIPEGREITVAQFERMLESYLLDMLKQAA